MYRRDPSSGSGLNQIHQIVRTARITVAVKFLASWSYRVATRRQSLRRENARSMRLRPLDLWHPARSSEPNPFAPQTSRLAIYPLSRTGLALSMTGMGRKRNGGPRKKSWKADISAQDRYDESRPCSECLHRRKDCTRRAPFARPRLRGLQQRPPELWQTRGGAEPLAILTAHAPEQERPWVLGALRASSIGYLGEPRQTNHS